jgi:hypothetical protein
MRREYREIFERHHPKIAGFSEVVTDIFWNPARDELQTSDLFRDSISVDSARLLNGNIEHVLNIIDAKLDSEREDVPDHRLLDSRAARWRLGLVHCLAFYFRAKCLRLEEEGFAPARTLATYIFRHVSAGDSIINFNYDNTIERVLYNAESRLPNRRPCRRIERTG